MFALKCSKASGVMHVYEASGYTVNPPKLNKSDEVVTTIESWPPLGMRGPIEHHVCKKSDVHYREIYIENAHGKTIEVIRGANQIPED